MAGRLLPPRHRGGRVVTARRSSHPPADANAGEHQRARDTPQRTLLLAAAEPGTGHTRARRTPRTPRPSVRSSVLCSSPPQPPSSPTGSPATAHPCPGATRSAPFRARRVSAGGRVPLIDRYAPPEIADLFTDEARFRTWLEVEVLASEAWAKLGVVPPADAEAIRERADFDIEAIRAREAVTDHETAAFVDVVQERIGGPAAKWVHYGLTSYDVVDTAMAVTLVRACDLILGQVDRLEAVIVATRTGASRHPDGRPHARYPRGADHLREQARAVGVATPPRPHPPRTRARGHRRRQSVGRGRFVLQRRPASRGVRVRTARAPARAVDAGDRPRPSRRVALRVRGTRFVDRVVRARSAAPSAHGSWRGAGAVRGRRAEGLQRDAAQAQPVAVRATLRARPRSARKPSGRHGKRRTVARTRHVALVGRAHRPSRLADPRLLHDRAFLRHRRRAHREHRADAREPRRVVRPRVQRGGAPRPGRGGSRARRRVPLGPAGCDPNVGARGAHSARCSRTTRRSPRTCRRPRLDECFDLHRAVAHAARAVDALDAATP